MYITSDQSPSTMFVGEVFIHYEGRREVLVPPDMHVTFDIAQFAFEGDLAVTSDWIGISFAVFDDLRHLAAGERAFTLTPDLGAVLQKMNQDIEHDGRGRGWRIPIGRNFRLIEADQFAALKEGARQ